MTIHYMTRVLQEQDYSRRLAIEVFPHDYSADIRLNDQTHRSLSCDSRTLSTTMSNEDLTASGVVHARPFESSCIAFSLGIVCISKIPCFNAICSGAITPTADQDLRELYRRLLRPRLAANMSLSIGANLQSATDRNLSTSPNQE